MIDEKAVHKTTQYNSIPNSKNKKNKGKNNTKIIIPKKNLKDFI